jgi:hypothetical protein
MAVKGCSVAERAGLLTICRELRMKTPQRNFVVEFKSRRQPKPRENSIWGDTDFKALAREIEGLPSDLSHSRETPVKVSPVSISSPDQASSSPDQASKHREIETAVPTDQVSPANAKPEAQAVPDLSAEIPAVMQSVTEAQAVIRVRRPRKAVPRVKPVRTVQLPKETRPERPVQTESPVGSNSLVEIAALDAENMRLKHLLVEHLREQNRQLRKMIGRLDIRRQA